MPHSTRNSFLRAQTIFIHQWTFPFWSLWLRVRTFLYFANEPFSIAKGPLPITCGPFCSIGPFIYPQYAVLFPSYVNRINSPGPSGLFHATQLFACRHLSPQADIFCCSRFARESCYVTRNELFTLLKDISTFERADLSPITCGFIQDACRPI